MVIYLSKLNDCFEKGLLIKTQKEPELSEKEIKQAEFFLKESEELLELNKKIISSIALYNSYFHCIRSLLFKDGIKERSHYCIARYFEYKYINKDLLDKKFLNAFETIMSIRHTAQYSTEPIEIEEDLNELINICEELLFKIKEIIKW